MATTDHSNQQYSPTKERVVLDGRILLASTPTIRAGKGFSVSKPATGKFRITPSQKYPRFVTARAVLHQTTPAAIVLMSPITDFATNGYFEFWTWLIGTGVSDPAATDEISFEAVFMMKALPL